MRPDGKGAALRARLETLYRRYGAPYLPTDPVELVHAYLDDRDVEIAAVVAAGLAFGNAVAIRASARRVLDRLGPHPARAAATPTSKLITLTRGIGHRWIRDGDIARCLGAIAGAQRGRGLQAFFLDADDRHPEHLEAAMNGFVRRLPEVRPFFAAPRDGSACKRFCLFLRWMVRGPDGIDLGIWRRIEPSRLTVPLDVHLARVSREMGILARRTDDWKAARELTRALAQADPQDPLRYDFALCRLGMLDRATRPR